MTIDIQRPDRNLYLSENAELMDDLSRAISQKLSIEESGIAIAAHFTNAATEEYLDKTHFRICLDHSFRDKLAEARNIAHSFGLKELDVSVSLASVFLEANADTVIEQYLGAIEQETGIHKENGSFGTYGLWGIMQRPSFYIPRPTIVLWYNDASALGKVVKSGKIPEFVEIDNKNGEVETVDILHVYTAPKI